jgi:hypothetical protein
MFPFFDIVRHQLFLNISVAHVFFWQVLGIILVGYIVFDSPYTFITDVSGHLWTDFFPSVKVVENSAKTNLP